MAWCQSQGTKLRKRSVIIIFSIFRSQNRAKRFLATDETITISDILGFEQQVPTSEVISAISPSIEKLASSIAEEIKRLNNGKSPQAVMAVGGGSLTPLLTKQLSSRLDLPENRVGIRGLDALSDVTLSESITSTPALVTPIGIAIAARRAPIHYMSVTVNEKTIRLFELKDMTVGDALLAANIKARQLYGKPGMGMSITLNGSLVTITGGTWTVVCDLAEREASKHERLYYKW